MTRQVFRNGRVFDGSELRDGLSVVIEDGRVVDVVPAVAAPADAEIVDLAGGILSPGFIDLQVNGGGGVLLNDRPSAESVAVMCAAHLRHGATAILPTVITDTPEVTSAAIRAVREAVEAGVPGCLGIHVEGPFIALARKGVHLPAYIRPLTGADMPMLTSTGLDHVLVTVAPEAASPEAITALARSGVRVALGHSDATYAEAVAGYDAGATLATHLFNAMSQFTSREPGMVGAVLDRGDVHAGLIADGFHVHPASIRAALAAKSGPARIYLVTDAMPTAGSEVGTFVLNGRKVTRVNGKLTTDDGTLAGSDLTMDQAIRYMVGTVGTALDEVLRMATSYPAEAMGLGDGYGRIVAGGRADLVHLRDDLTVAGVWVKGQRLA